MSWTDERVVLLKKLWSDGLSASQIAAELGNDIAFGLGDNKGFADGTAALGDDGPHRYAPLQIDGDRTFGEGFAAQE